MGGLEQREWSPCRQSVAAPQFLDIIYLGHYNGLLSYIRFLMLLLFLQVNCKIYGSFLIHISWFLLLRRSRRLRRPSTTLTRTTTASSPRQSFEKSSIVSAKRSGIQMCSRESGSQDSEIGFHLQYLIKLEILVRTSLKFLDLIQPCIGLQGDWWSHAFVGLTVLFHAPSPCPFYQPVFPNSQLSKLQGCECKDQNHS